MDDISKGIHAGCICGTGRPCGLPDWSAAATRRVPLQEVVGWAKRQKAAQRLLAASIPGAQNVSEAGNLPSRLDGYEDCNEPRYPGRSERTGSASHITHPRD